MGLRHDGGFVGGHDRETGAPLPEHISARPDDLASLVDGLVAYEARVRSHGLDPVIAAASIAFGFVYMHPFADGNGRVHRWLIHHVLSVMRYGPSRVVFPVSSTMLRELDSYRTVLESYSRPLLDCIDWRPTATRDHYRFFDATAHSEFLYHCIEETVEKDWPAELAYLEGYDRFAAGVQEIVDMPQLETLYLRTTGHEGRDLVT